jgi:hypothetical protein
MFGVLLGTLQKFKENSSKEAARVGEENFKFPRKINFPEKFQISFKFPRKSQLSQLALYTFL